MALSLSSDERKEGERISNEMDWQIMGSAEKAIAVAGLEQQQRAQERPLETSLCALSLATAQQDHQTVILVIERSGTRCR